MVTCWGSVSYTHLDVYKRQGQSPYQIITNHPELELSVRSVYTYLDMGILTARNIDLKRKVKFKPCLLYTSRCV